MSDLWPLLGVAMITLVAVDVLRTVLLPTSTGVTDLGLARLSLVVVRALPERFRTAALRGAGPSSLVLTVAIWLGVLWWGFALVYLPSAGELVYVRGVRPDDPGLVGALYLSGTALTTLGFGDVVAPSAGLRITTVVEAAAGLAMVTATLGYLPSIYTVVSQLRAANQSVADLDAGDPQAAADLLAVDAPSVLDGVRRDVLATRQHLQRFPVLHYFHPPVDESVVVLVRGATGLWVAARFAPRHGAPVPRYRKALEQALRRLVDELLPHTGRAALEEDDAGAREVFARAARAYGSPPSVDEEEVALLRRVLAVTTAYARNQTYEP